MRDRIRILIASPKRLMPDLLKVALSANSRFTVVSHISSFEELPDLLERERIDIALVSPALSVERPDQQVFRSLRTELPGIKLIALLETRQREVVIEVFRQGVRGVLSLQHVGFDMLCRCLDCVDNGQIWASNEEIGWVMNAFEDTPFEQAALNIVDAAGLKLLTSREEDVVLLVMDGLSNRDIARALALSEHTVKNYMFHIFDKLGVSSRTELVAYATNASKKLLAISLRQVAVAKSPVDSCAKVSARRRKTDARARTNVFRSPAPTPSLVSGSGTSRAPSSSTLSV